MTMNSKVKYNRCVTLGYYLIGIEGPLGPVKPGHFVMLKLASTYEPLLRRPFSVYDYHKVKARKAATGKARAGGARAGGASVRSVVEILYKVVGKGTELMSRLVPGDSIDVLGPLGGSVFPKVKTQSDKSRLVMVAGGIGIAPFYMLASRFKGEGRGGAGASKVGSGGRRDKVVKGLRPRLLLGARSKTDACLASRFVNLGVDVKIATEDGSQGRRGLVTELLASELTDDTLLYACGPLGMLRAVSEMAAERGVKAYVSMERTMACGIGVCLGCAVRTHEHSGKLKSKSYEMVCSDGPVFEGSNIDWERL